MERSKSMISIDSLKNSSRKHQSHGKRLAQMMISNVSAGDTKISSINRKPIASMDLTPSLRRTKSKKNMNAQSGDLDIGSQVKVLDAGVKLCARKLNESKAQGDRLEEELGERLDECRELSFETSALKNMINGNNNDAKQIEKLTKETEKVNKNSAVKLHYRLQLNHVNQRLRRNSISLDGHMIALTDTSIAAEKEIKKCEKMLGDIQSSHTKGMRDLETAKREVEIERAERQRALHGRRIESENAERMEAWRLEREGSRLELEESFCGAQKQEKERRIRLLSERETELEKLQMELDAKTGKLSSLEESFKHIKQATGVNSLTEMVEKFTNHQEHRNRLLVEKREAEDQLNSAKKSLEDAHETFDRVKANGFGDTEFNREMIDDMEENIAKERTGGKAVKSTNVRLEGTLVALRQGGMGLYQRLLAFHPTLLDGEAPNLSESATTSAIQAAYDTLEMLKVTEQILGKMLDAVGGLEGLTNNFDVTVPTNRNESDATKESLETLSNPNLAGNNCRIKAKEVTPRLSDDENCDDRSDTYSALNDDAEATEHTVLSRRVLKTSSVKRAGDARREEELEEKRKIFEEKSMLADDNEQSAVTIRKRQAEANARMAKHNLPVGLPKSLKVRDDPMTKAQAFLTETPQLD